MGTFQEIGLLLLAALLALTGVSRPAADPEAQRFSCSRPAGLRLQERDYLLCLERPEAGRATRQAGCYVPLEDEDLLTAQDGCRVLAEPLPGAWLLQLGRRLDINRAGEEDLRELPGIGPQLSRRLIEWRTRRGRIECLEELRQVKGIGPKRLQLLRDKARVESAHPLAP